MDTVDGAAVPRGRALRMAVALAITLAHLAVAVFLLSRRPAVAPVLPVAAIAVRAVPVAARATAAATEPPIDAGVRAPTIDIVAATPAAPVACDVIGTIAAAAGRDPVSATALAPIAADPRRTVMVWDGHWAASAAAQAIRTIARDVLAATPAACRTETLTGPRLIFVAVDGAAVTVAVGSGNWSWSQLMSSDDGTLPSDSITRG